MWKGGHWAPSTLLGPRFLLTSQTTPQSSWLGSLQFVIVGVSPKLDPQTSSLFMLTPYRIFVCFHDFNFCLYMFMRPELVSSSQTSLNSRFVSARHFRLVKTLLFIFTPNMPNSPVS